MAGETGQQGGMQVDLQPSGPMKRRAPENEGTALTLETIREAIGEAIRGELQEVRQDIRHFATRVDHVESQVTKQMQQTINLLDEMTHKHAEHGGILQQLPEANREVRSRLEQLGGEYCCTILRWGRPPALVIGGWDPDQDAKVTKSEAEDILKSVGGADLLGQHVCTGGETWVRYLTHRHKARGELRRKEGASTRSHFQSACCMFLWRICDRLVLKKKYIYIYIYIYIYYGLSLNR